VDKKKILLVEDETDLRILVAQNLQEAGYEVYQAADGNEGFRLAKEMAPDIIISDVVMPKKDGNQLLKELRKSDFGRHIPFIILTAHVKMKDYFDIVAVDDFIQKPFKTEELIARIEKVFLRHAKTAPRPVSHPGVSSEESVWQNEFVTDLPEVTEVLVNKDIVQQMKLDPESKGPYGVGPKDKTLTKSKKGQMTVKKKILIVENDFKVYSGLQNLFESNDCVVEIAHTPAKCFEAAVRFCPDVIISKYVLYAMKADKMVGILREMSHLHDIPIIVYSDRESGGIEENVISAGANCFLMNPGEDKILKKTDEFLRRRDKI